MDHRRLFTGIVIEMMIISCLFPTLNSAAQIDTTCYNGGGDQFRLYTGCSTGLDLTYGGVWYDVGKNEALLATGCDWGLANTQYYVPCQGGPYNSGAEDKCATGMIDFLAIAPDGDINMNLYGNSINSLININNVQSTDDNQNQHAGLVTEIPVGDRSKFSNLADLRGQQTVTVCGKWVIDIAHGWNELHPVSSIAITPDFSVSCTPSTLSVVAGQSGSATCTVVSTTGQFNSSPVSLSCSRPGCSFTPTSVTPPQAFGSASSALTMNIDPSTPSGGPTVFNVVGSRGSLSNSFSMDLNVLPSSCLIATAAFGSPLAPQVQFLRDFRDNHLQVTSVGSEFLKVFNQWYYSFSPQVADYERQNFLFRDVIRGSLYPLLGILFISEKAFFLLNGNYGTITAGLVSVSMMGAVYISPLTLSLKKVRSGKFGLRRVVLITTGIMVSVLGSILSGDQTTITITSLFFLLSIISLTALATTKASLCIAKKLREKFNK